MKVTRLQGLTVVGIVVVVGALGAVMVGPAPSEPPEHPVFLVEKLDCSPSMRGVQPNMARTATRITEDAARVRSVLVAGTFAGDPGRSASPFPVVHRYARALNVKDDGTGGNANLGKERLQRDGKAQGQRVAALFACAGDEHGGGTPLLSVLAQCAEQLRQAKIDPDVERRVVLYSDGGIIGDGLDVRHGITDAQIDAAVAAFVPRLRGLAGARVWVIGAGSGTTIHGPVLDQVHELLRKVVEGAGGKLEGFTPTSVSYPR
jgi:hypothetical protein